MRYLPVGLSTGMALAGEMPSVLTESPSMTSTRAASMSCSGAGSGVRSWKNGGSRMYVESGSHS